MKIRNGFVSNSSSSSFILFMPKEKMSISDIEKYFDGYSNELDQKHKDFLTLAIWRSQYMTPGFEDERTFNEGDIETIYSCNNYDCYNRRYDFDKYDPYSSCKNCDKCTKIERPYREDDYYEVLDRYSNDEEISKRIKDNCNKSIYRVEIDDNEHPRCMTFEETYEMRQSIHYLKDSDKLIKEYE